MAFNKEKLKAVILHVCAKCHPSRLGAVKLHKVLYFSDMLHYADVGKPITGSTYRKRILGPTCEQLLSTLSELERDGSLEIRKVSYFGYLKKEYVVHGSPETNQLSSEELSLLNEVVEFVCESNSAKTISEFSHNRAWEMVEFGEIIPYTSVFSIFPTQVSKEAIDWATTKANEIESSGQNKDAVDLVDYTVFRKRILQEIWAGNEAFFELLENFDQSCRSNPRACGESVPISKDKEFWIFQAPPIARLPKLMILYEIDDTKGHVIAWNISLL